jgi:hypothetical protein
MKQIPAASAPGTIAATPIGAHNIEISPGGSRPSSRGSAVPPRPRADLAQ